MLNCLLSSYSLDESGGVKIEEGVLWGIPKVCAVCEKYKLGKCSNGNDGYSVCKYNCAIYELQGQVWFGLQIKELRSGWRMLRYDRPFLLKQSQLQYLIAYDQQLLLYAEAISQAAEFSEDYDTIIGQMISSIPNFSTGEWEKDLKATTLSGESILKLVDALNLLKEKKRSFGALLSNPRFQDILPYRASGRSNSSLILPDERCVRCRSQVCSKDDAPVAIQCACKCPNGVFYIKGFSRTYYGLKILEEGEWKHRKKIKDIRTRITFSLPQIKRLLCFLNLKESRINEARRFLHDLGQYISSIQNLLPYVVPKYSEGRRTASPAMMSVSSLRSIHAMVMALGCLKDYLFRTNVKRRRREFSLYQLFDKYRYCFYDVCPKVNMIKEENGFYDLISSYEGFEFVVLNLLNNAVKYLPVDDTYRTIDVVFSHVKKGAVIKVVSLGVVVDKDDLTRLGTRWFRGRRARASGVQGEGLGLYAIKEYMKQSGFGIKFKSSGEIVESHGVEYRDFTVEIFIPKCYMHY